MLALLLGLALGALLFAGTLADNGGEGWIGLLVGPFCALLGWIAIGGLFARVRQAPRGGAGGAPDRVCGRRRAAARGDRGVRPPLGVPRDPGFVLLLLGGRREGEKYAGLRILR